MALNITKVYVDSRFKTRSSSSNTDFKFTINQSIDLPDNCYCYIDDVQIPHTWYSVEDFNNKLYFQQDNAGIVTNKILTLSIQNHTGTSLASNLQSLLNTEFGGGSYVVAYNTNKGTITITSQEAQRMFQIFTEEEMHSNMPGWDIPYEENLKSANEIFRLSSTMGSVNSYETGFLDLLNIHSLYLRSSNLGSFQTIGARGESDIIKKIPVSSGYGYLIIDTVVSNHDKIDVSRQTLKTLEFRLTNVKGEVVDLHGAHVSWSLVFVQE